MQQSGEIIPASPRSRIGDLAIDDRRIRLLGYAVVLIVFFGLGTWAAIAPLASAAHAPGKIRVESNRKTVQHLEGGIVSSLPVRDGDFVEKDQIVMTLDDTQAKSQLEIVHGLYVVALAREARLAAQRDQMEQVD
ncbi:MAG: biotin/lipoyl-binding protein, partial [Gammaproteobacteria bacterium]|nr:biotin/lipoyl-binding protein [Gammaproteobacteria bacterium]